MIEILKFAAMIILSGALASLSAVMHGGMGMMRAFILGSMISAGIVIGYFYEKKDKRERSALQSMIGMLMGAIAGGLMLLLKLKAEGREFGNTLNSSYMIILLACIYGNFFQVIVNCNCRLKFLKILTVSFLCILVKLIYMSRTGLSLGAIPGLLIFTGISAVLFATLWYFPVWLLYTRKHSFKVYFRCTRLNLRMMKLLLLGRWLSKRDYAQSYDMVASTYDSQWLCQLQPVTEELLRGLPAQLPEGDILDLGCGTGLSTATLEKYYSDNPVIGMDISPEMLKLAHQKCIRAEFEEGDILDFLRERLDNSAALIFSGWAIGYSHPSLIIEEAARVLKPGGTFAFVVNYYDTLAPVFYAFRKCMNKFPGQVNMALHPRFPKKAGDLLLPLEKNGFIPDAVHDGKIPIKSPEGDVTLEWLLKTGVLAGFDQVMPLHKPEISEYFNANLKSCEEPVLHHYFMGAFVKRRDM